MPAVEPVESDYPQVDVVAVGAHPDDVEIACGGTLARLVQQGHKVAIVDLTDGEPTPQSPGPEVRLAEAADAARVLGVHQRVTLDLPNRRLFDTFEARVLLAKEFRKLRPKIVIGFGDNNVAADAHPVDRRQFLLRRSSRRQTDRRRRGPDPESGPGPRRDHVQLLRLSEEDRAGEEVRLTVEMSRQESESRSARSCGRPAARLLRTSSGFPR